MLPHDPPAFWCPLYILTIVCVCTMVAAIVGTVVNGVVEVTKVLCRYVDEKESDDA